MPPSTSDSLYQLCVELLDAADAALALAPGGTIPRKYVSPGLPAFDCEQLTVHAGGPAEAPTAPLEPPLQPGRRTADGTKYNLITTTITVVRCVTTVSSTKTVPKAAALDNDARTLLGDVWTIWNHLATMKRAGSLFPPDQRDMFFDPAVSLITSGGFGAWELPLRIQLDGYRTM